MLTIILIVLALLEAVIIYGLISSARFYTCAQEVLQAIKKAIKKQQPPQSKSKGEK